ncbi:MAG: glycogen debranching protein GlgX [Steroidobacteraceae bacterium]
MPHSISIGRGEPLPLGTHHCCDGVNVAVFSRHATALTLVLFEDGHSIHPTQSFDLDPERHRTGDIWHARLHGELRDAQYALKATGLNTPYEGHRFDSARFLLDPYAAAVDGGQLWRTDTAPLSDARNAAIPTMRCDLIADAPFDWGFDTPPRLTWGESIIYETHVRGLTAHPTSGVAHPGQYLGVVEKIPYFKSLGITAIELMPVQAFNPLELDRRNPVTNELLHNYWGYNPIALFAPMTGYASQPLPQKALAEFKTMVRELHRAGIEVILDVVFNHTAEGNALGSTYSFRGLDNVIYYLLTPDKQSYLDFTGCGNTLNCNHPIVRNMIIDCLRHWVMHFHIDGFRFDLASVLGRNSQGQLLTNPPLLEQIAEDPLLREVKLIAEAWDSAGAFQVGHFPGQRWAEWNCHFRDDVRRFWRGDPGWTGRFATRLCGSADLYDIDGASPLKSINFITCHDGFTLRDLVSYSHKHNYANGEDDRDGLNENYSENHGVEGPSSDPSIVAVRKRQARNMLASLFLSRGVPMLLGGDEFGRTQAGNNNAYCQDNEVSWYDWNLVAQQADLIRFVQRLIALRSDHVALRAERFYRADEIEWFDEQGQNPDWDGAKNILGCLIHDSKGTLCMLFNATSQGCRFRLPSHAQPWRVVIDTSKLSPGDAPERGGETILDGVTEVHLDGKTMLLLLSP